MVHALGEIRRVLVPDGILIDLRPLQERWPIEVVTVQEVRETGRVQDFPSPLADDAAANQAMLQVSTDGWFLREREEFFPFYYTWDTPREMEDWIAEEWEDFITLDGETQHATRSAWALGGAEAQVRLNVKILITRWRVVKEL